jgi:hypothetical protein
VSETANTAAIAEEISRELFRHFRWKTHPKTNDNFPCEDKEHLGAGGKPKTTHPGDVVFFYTDPYLGKPIYLHTDLKSYATDSITSTSLRGAFKSLCMTIDCAKCSASWREKYSVPDSEQHEVRGFLFLNNHDNGYEKSFYDAVDKVSLGALPVAAGTQIHFFGPHDIQRIYSIANDMLRMIAQDELPKDYTFYYPDLVMSRRQGDVWDQPATIEALTAPYLIIKFKAPTATSKPGYLIYYNAPASSVEELEYFIDSLSRYQLLESGERLVIKVGANAPEDIKSIFHTAKKKYVKAWGFDPVREQILEAISIERLTAVTSTYNPGDMGWRE